MSKFNSATCVKQQGNHKENILQSRRVQSMKLYKTNIFPRKQLRGRRSDLCELNRAVVSLKERRGRIQKMKRSSSGSDLSRVALIPKQTGCLMTLQIVLLEIAFVCWHFRLSAEDLSQDKSIKCCSENKKKKLYIKNRTLLTCPWSCGHGRNFTND